MDSYILSAYSKVTQPKGPMSRAVEAIKWDINGFDPQRWDRLAREIKTATVEDQPRAVEILRKLQADQYLATIATLNKGTQAVI